METKRLFEIDAYIRTFEAVVQTCEPQDGGYAVVLNQTAFFPEGGGQASDLGVLGQARVLDVQERAGEIVHTCDAPVPVGSVVSGSIDWPHRFRLMQQHSGEHLVSGLIHARYGWDNVGFHMGADVITIDFNGPIPPQALPELEWASNEAVWADTASEIFFPTPEELEKLSYRSKKALTGRVRLVRFPGVDLCACCGTHVRRTGEIGVIKLLRSVNFHGGTRMELQCGAQALEYLAAIERENHAISVQLSAKPLETAAAVRRVYDERTAALSRLGAVEADRFARMAASLSGSGDCLLFEQGLSADSVRRLAVAVMERCGGRCAVFSGDDETGYQYAIGKPGGDLRSFVRQMNEVLHGRGGGKPFFAQGSVRATRAEIETYFA